MLDSESVRKLINLFTRIVLHIILWFHYTHFLSINLLYSCRALYKFLSASPCLCVQLVSKLPQSIILELNVPYIITKVSCCHVEKFHKLGIVVR